MTHIPVRGAGPGVGGLARTARLAAARGWRRVVSSPSRAFWAAATIAFTADQGAKAWLEHVLMPPSVEIQKIITAASKLDLSPHITHVFDNLPGARTCFLTEAVIFCDQAPAWLAPQYALDQAFTKTHLIAPVIFALSLASKSMRTLYGRVVQRFWGSGGLQVGFGLLVGGILGNKVSLLKSGASFDFIPFAGETWNLADIAICSGTALTAWLVAALVPGIGTRVSK